jgi:hypothetical protein
MDFLDAREIRIEGGAMQFGLLNDQQGQEGRCDKAHEEGKHLYSSSTGSWAASCPARDTDAECVAL